MNEDIELEPIQWKAKIAIHCHLQRTNQRMATAWVKEGQEFGILTSDIAQETFDITPGSLSENGRITCGSRG